MNKAGYAVDTITACGGGTKNRVFLREHANITECRIVMGAEPEAVLSGLGGAGGGGGWRFSLDHGDNGSDGVPGRGYRAGDGGGPGTIMRGNIGSFIACTRISWHTAR